MNTSITGNADELTTSGGSKYNYDLQGLRSIAILLVVLYHIDRSLMPGGYVGVDVFYAISGFLITGLLAQEIEATGTVHLPRFWARRARRLLPAAILVLLVTVAIARFTLSPLSLKLFSSAAVATSLYLGNFWFAHLSTDYLHADEAGANPLLHYWSLCVEEQFYLLWPPLVLLLVWLWRRHRRADAGTALIPGLATVVVLSLAASVALTERAQAWAFFGTPTRAWEFALGGITAVVVRRRPLSSSLLANLAVTAGVACLVVAAVRFDQHTAFPGVAALLPVAGTCLILATSTRRDATRGTAFLRVKPMQVLGDLSYSWYLWHWPIILLVQARGDDRYSILAGVGGALVSLLLAWATYVLVENPLRFNRRLAASNRLSIAMGVVLAVAGAGVAFGQRQEAALALRSPQQQRYARADVDLPRIYGDGCHADISVVEARECTFGRAESDTVIVLFGDSHAAHWFPALEDIAGRRGWRLVSMTKSGCPPYEVEPVNLILGRRYRECSRWRELMYERMATLEPDLVIMGASSVYDLEGAARNPALPSAAEQWRRGVRLTMDRMTALRLPFASMRDVPWLPERAPECLSRAAWLGRDSNTACAVPERSQRKPLEVVAYGEMVRAGAAVIDLNLAICARRPCPVERDGMILYSDNHHLTASFSRSLAPALELSIDRLLRFPGSPGSTP